MQNRQYTLHVDQICELIGAPTADTYGSFHINLGFDSQKASFWKKISGQRKYEPSTAKASCIIHPVLKVAHRIIASFFFPQAEVSKASKKELELLWCMVTQPDKTSHFGEWVIYKLLKVNRSSSGAIHCGGLVTLIARHPAVNLQIHAGAAQIFGDTLLTTPVLENMQLFHTDGNETIWTVGGRGSIHIDYFRVDRNNRRLLVLKRPISNTVWRLASNIGVPPPGVDSDDDDEENEDEDEDIPDAPQADPSGAGPSHPPHPPAPRHHDMYMSEFNRLNCSVNSLNDQMSVFREDLQEFDVNYYDYTHTVDARLNSMDTYMHQQWAQQQQHNANVDAMMRDMHYWTINQPGYHPPPPPPEM